MIASTPGICLMELEDRKIVLPARTAISTGHKEIEDTRGGSVGAEAGAAAGPSRSEEDSGHEG